MKLLLHCCCAPCTVKCVDSLGDENIRPGLLWYNPNIHPYTEYQLRRETLSRYAADQALNLDIIDEYGLRRFIRGVLPFLEAAAAPPGTEPPPDGDRAAANGDRAAASGDRAAANGDRASRCAWCYRTRLEKTAAQAAEGGWEGFSTTLLISPWQDHQGIRRAGEQAAEKYGVPFLYRDFRPLFREGQKKAREMGLYRQKYCGCVFSEEERYLTPREPVRA
jgi:predicted adenine nucleotide alpha hydrolase (AANH) superfamily ATPase